MISFFTPAMGVTVAVLLAPKAIIATESSRLEAMADAYHHWGLFQGTVLVARHDEILFQKGYGAASIGGNRPNSIDTVYPIASLSKQFTAAALLRLREQGEVSFEDPVSEYLPTLRSDLGERMTILQILQHRAGLRRDIFLGGPAEPDREFTLDELIEEVNKTELQSEPGSVHAYSNLGYVVLAAVLEEVTASSYGEAMDELLFEPLGMRRTRHATNHSGEEEVASGHSTLIDEVVPVLKTARSAQTGGGSLYSTVGDLHLWARELLEPKVLSPESVALLRAENLGVFTFPYSWPARESGEPKGSVIYHGGSTDGYASALAIYVEHGLTVVALSNNQPAWTEDLYNQLANIPLGFDEAPPRRNLARSMYQTLSTDGIDAAESLWRKADQEGAWDRPSSKTMNRVGYLFLERDRFNEAVQAFELFVRVRPDDANAWDSLGEAHARAGHREQAIRAYEESLRQNPYNGGAKAMLKSLRGE